MSPEQNQEPRRDATISPFGEILRTLCQSYDQIEAAVFYDTLGETIDYFSYQEPYLTRLTAAHHGLIFESARFSLDWLKMGKIEMLEICNSQNDSVTVRIDDDSFLTIVTRSGTMNEELYELLKKATLLLREEAGY
ncbi:MAG: hypothetical protein GY847_37535 [Proteobacteria bacterium]|nr:hypothetical protein [Pseudomonadota bacterium]